MSVNNINILQNITIRPPLEIDKCLKGRITSSMVFLDEEPAFTDSESESEFDTQIPENETTAIKRNMSITICSKTPTESINSKPKKQVCDVQVQCEILSSKSDLRDLKDMIEICANLEPTGEYEELISVCKKLNNKNDYDHHNVDKNKEMESPPSRFGETTTEPSLKKAKLSVKRVAGVRKSTRIPKHAKRKKSLTLQTTKNVEDNSSKNVKKPDPGNLFNIETAEFLKPKTPIPRRAVKSLARNWMNPNKSFTALETSMCQQHYLSLQHRKTRRLYSPSQWMDSEEFMNHCS